MTHILSIYDFYKIKCFSINIVYMFIANLLSWSTYMAINDSFHPLHKNRAVYQLLIDRLPKIPLSKEKHKKEV